MELLKKYWEMKIFGSTPSVKWKILQKARLYKIGNTKFDLCVSKKLNLDKIKDKQLFNKRTEFITKCWHKLKFTLEKIKNIASINNKVTKNLQKIIRRG